MSGLRARLKSGECLGLHWLVLGNPFIAEMAGRTEALPVLDLQHGLWTREGVEAAVGLVRGPVMARVMDGSAASVGPALDAGCAAVLVPMIETAEQAAAAVAAAQFPPRGTRSGGGVRPLAQGFSRYLASVDTVVGIMIETRAGVAAVEAIAATPGLDFILIGTGDLSISCDSDKAEVEAGCARVKAACAAAGIACGIFTPNIEVALQRRAEGYGLVVLANDIDALTGAFEGSARRFGEGP